MHVEDGRTGFVHELPMMPGGFLNPWQRQMFMQRLAMQRRMAPGFYRPPPVGWVTPALPFTGTQPRRPYMRCSVWPAPAGLVPQFATQPQMPGMPGMPGAQPGMPGGGGRHRGRRGRRRR
jgi:hypothetical protein